MSEEKKPTYTVWTSKKAGDWGTLDVPIDSLAYAIKGAMRIYGVKLFQYRAVRVLDEEGRTLFYCGEIAPGEEPQS